MDNNNFKLGDIVYTGWKWMGDITIYKCKIVKINPKSFWCVDLRIKWREDETENPQRLKYIFKTEEECIDFYKNK